MKNKSACLKALLFALFFLYPLFAYAQPTISSCSETDLFKKLDFWVGEWNVFAGDRQVGTNRIEKILDGCAILEHWRSARGGEGKSLFYVDPVQKIWKQVWVTRHPLRPGGTKEKQQIATFENGAIRFQGKYMRNGTLILDRTTLTPISQDSVRQHIQTSADGGDTWGRGFNAIYIRKER